MKFNPGDTFYLRKGLPSDPLYKCHVVAVVDECMVVYKWYGKRKQWWHYEVEDEEFLESMINIWKEVKNEKRRVQDQML